MRKSEVKDKKSEVSEIAESFIEDVQSAADAGMLSEVQPRELAEGEKLVSVDAPDGVTVLGDFTPEPAKERNIIYVGEGEPSTEYFGAFKVTLPDAETQKRGFYHPDARRIIQNLPRKYKKFVRKGE